jgi:hypothetical protein
MELSPDRQVKLKRYEIYHYYRSLVLEEINHYLQIASSENR